jgi:peptidoglycan/LPS O-acetylase OafA/YrhL
MATSGDDRSADAEPGGAAPARPPRRHDIDWLRIAAVLLLIPFHCARVFDPQEAFYVQSEQLSDALYAFIVFVAPWHMPLLFVLAGASSWFALRHRSGGAYVGERVRRLLVPFLFGLAVIVPPQSWLGYITHGHGDLSFLAYYSQYWTTADPEFTGYEGGWTPGHLWFILWLLVISLLALPVFLWLRGARRRAASAAPGAEPSATGSPPARSRLLDLLARPRRLPSVLVVAPVLLVLTEPSEFMEVSGQNLFGYFLFLVAGFVLVADERIEAALSRAWPFLLGVGVAAMAVYTTLALAAPDDAPLWQELMIGTLLRQLAAWVLILGLLGIGRRLLARPARALPYMAEAAYPFYILHQTVIVLLAWGIVGFALPAAGQYVLLAATSLVATVAVYEVAVRRWRPVRFLFGMKARPQGRA